MAKVVLLAIGSLGILIPGAHAVDWKINATQSETLEANSNRTLLPKPLGPSYNSISSLLFNARALTPTSTFTFNGNLDYRTFGGPGESTTLNTLNNSVDAKFEKVERSAVYNIIASRTERDTGTLQLLETGQTTVNGSTITSTGGGGFSRELGPRDTLSSQTTLSETETNTTGAVPAAGTTGTRSTFTSLLSTLDLKHRSDPVTTWLPSLQYQQLSFGGAAPSEVTFWKATTGVDTDLTKLLHIKTSAGGTVLNGGQGAQTLTGPAVNTISQSSKPVLDWVADMTLSYKYRYGTVSLTAAQTTGPTALGQFVKTKTVGTSVSYTINEASSVSLNASFSNLASTTSSDVLSVSGTYSYLFMRDLHADLTYRYTQRTSPNSAVAAIGAPLTTTDVVAHSNAVLFVLRREVTVLP